MALSALLTKGGRAAATGVVGVLLVDAAKRVGKRGGAREGAVVATSWALRGRRVAEVRAENLRLAGADVVAEARARVGEQAPVPDATAHDHQH